MNKRSIYLFFLCAFCASVHAAEIQTNSLGMEFVRIPAGEFTMGTENTDDVLFEMPSPEKPEQKEHLLADETPAHPVRISQDFYLGKTEVTQKQWLDVMGTRPGPAKLWNHPRWQQLPVVSISWNQAIEFINTLQTKEPQRAYRLPTEAEWEYAAREGQSGLRPFDDEALTSHAWFIENSGDVLQAVAQLKPNAWGLYDMLGNAWEWTNDYYAKNTYQRDNAVDPTGPVSGNKRVRRGGSFHCQQFMVRPAYRAADPQDTRYSVLGFRVAYTAKQD